MRTSGPSTRTSTTFGALRVVGALSAALLLAACGSATPAGTSTTSAAPTTGSASPSVTSSPPGTGTSTSATPTPVLVVHKATKGEPALFAISGFTYDDVSPDMNVGKAMAAGLNKEHRGMAVGYSTHWVESDLTDTLVLAQIKINPKDHLPRGILFEGAQAGAKSFNDGAKVKVMTISGERVAVSSHVSDNRLSTIYAWARPNLMVFVISVTPSGDKLEAAESLAFVTKYIAAQRG